MSDDAKCEACGGTGQVLRQLAWGVFESDDYGVRTDPCRACKGTGKRSEKEPSHQGDPS